MIHGMCSHEMELCSERAPSEIRTRKHLIGCSRYACNQAFREFSKPTHVRLPRAVGCHDLLPRISRHLFDVCLFWTPPIEYPHYKMMKIKQVSNDLPDRMTLWARPPRGLFGR
jgi:hypothetical protein